MIRIPKKAISRRSSTQNIDLSLRFVKRRELESKSNLFAHASIICETPSYGIY
jgi:hypothetical protein